MKVTIGFIMGTELLFNSGKSQGYGNGLIFVGAGPLAPDTESMQAMMALGMKSMVEVKADPGNLLSGYELYWVEGVSKDWQDELRLLGPMVMDDQRAEWAEFKANRTGHPQMIQIAKQLRAEANESLNRCKSGLQRYGQPPEVGKLRRRKS